MQCAARNGEPEGGVPCVWMSDGIYFYYQFLQDKDEERNYFHW